MKFSHSVQFNAVPDWSSHYISYSNLKKLIYTLEKTSNQTRAGRDAEASPLIDPESSDPDRPFQHALDGELEKICKFYESKEHEIYATTAALLHEKEEYDAEREADRINVENGGSEDPHRGTRKQPSSLLRRFSSTKARRPNSSSHSMSMSLEEERGGADSDEDDENDETAALTKLSRKRSNTNASHASALRSSRELPRPARRRRPSQAFDDYSEQALHYDSTIALKKRTIGVYVSLCELRSFIQLNKTGFAKALKKFDKILDRRLKTSYLENHVNAAYPFKSQTMDTLGENVAKVEAIYADVVLKGDIAEAKRELRLHLREHVVWERNTVWREMIGIERKAQAANMGLRRTLLGRDDDPSKARRQGDEPDWEGHARLIASTRWGRVYCPRALFSSAFFTLLAIATVFVTLLKVPIMQKEEQQNCLAMLVAVSLLWATEVIPLFVTSLLVPLLAVTLRVVCIEHAPYTRLDAPAAAAYIFAAMWTPVIMLLLGGFAIAAALSKYDIAKLLATFVLSKAGTRPRTVLLTNMFVAMISSMWISNVAAPVLCLSIIQPMLRNLPSDSRFSKALILGIALASNIGGMASPIASPQNIIALQNMKPQPSWGVWFFVALPVCIVSILLIWILLLVTFQPGKGTHIVPIRPMKDPFTGMQWFISAVTIGTILLWCITHQLEGLFGDMGVVALLPLVIFFGTGILTKEDFNNFLWTIIILAAGGLALGKAVNSSGLLHTISQGVTKGVDGMSLYGVLVVFSGLILVVATFISHTVAALIILPLVRQVGSGMSEPHPNLLVMGSALMCSAAMGLASSGFPNMTAIMMEDSQTGLRYLRVYHFISRGVPSSLITMGVVITLGYGLMLVVGL